MKITAKNLAYALFEAAGEKPQNISEIIKQFYFYLLKKRKTKLIPFILEKLTEIEREKRREVEIEIETAKVLSSEQKKRILLEIEKKLTEKQKVILKERINERIIGGIILKKGETVLDNSLLSNLERLKEEMWKNRSN